MRIPFVSAAFLLALLQPVYAEKYFYDVTFDKDRLNQPPAVDLGSQTPTGPLVSPPLIVKSFGHLTNKPALFTTDTFAALSFDLARGTPDYFLEADFETHDFNKWNPRFLISLWDSTFQLQGNGQLYTSAEGNNYHLLEMKDDELHHIRIRADQVNRRWSFQLDDSPPLTGDLYGRDVQSIYLSVQRWDPEDTGASLAIDNIRIGTSSDFVPLTVLHSLNGFDGGQPSGKLARGLDGSFYGTAQIAGAALHSGDGFGTVFKLDAKGKLLWRFPFHGTDGSAPIVGVTMSLDQFLYGTTSAGGRHGCGTIFKMTQGGRLVWSVSLDGTNGATPSAELTQTRAGILYGTSSTGGRDGLGTVFKVNAFGMVETLHSFTGSGDGVRPLCQLTEGDDGLLYGTTSASRPAQSQGTPGSIQPGSPTLSGGGTVFKITPDGKLTTLFSFSETNGFSPRAGLAKGGKGIFYGVTAGGGASSQGTVFKITSAGQFDLLHSFTVNEQGIVPIAALTLAKDGYLYGTTQFGGANNISTEYGTVFRITAEGMFQKLASFHGGDGSFPAGTMIESTRGKFFGTTPGGYVSPGKVYQFSAARPVLAIKSPAPDHRYSETRIELLGRAKGDLPVTNVVYQVNGGDWINATSTNSWLNWSGDATLATGRNVIRAYAVNAFGDTSLTNVLRIQHRSHP